MKKALAIFLTTLFFGTSSFSQSTYNLTVEVKGIKKVMGNMSICIVTEKGDFLETCKIGKNIPIESKDFSAVFEDIPADSYAISIFQDENENGKLDMGKLVPIPKEKYGFSNNPPSTFGPPTFEECLFELNKNMTIVIDI